MLERRGISFLITPIVDFLFPPTCVLCGGSSERLPWICLDCRRRVVELHQIICDADMGDFPHLSDPLAFDRIWSVWPYDPEIESLIHQVKYRFMRGLGLWLGRTAARLLGAHFQPEEGLLVPVPLHPRRLRERGFNQSRLYAEGYDRRFHLPIDDRILIRSRRTRPQAGLSAIARQENVRGAFRVRKPEKIGGRRIYLVDDVATTGATMNACARALKEAGAAEVIGLALVRPRIDERRESEEPSEEG